MSPAGEPPLKLTGIDADIVWLYDMPAELGVHPHDAPNASILIDGPHLYLNTNDGVEHYRHSLTMHNLCRTIQEQRTPGTFCYLGYRQPGTRV